MVAKTPFELCPKCPPRLNHKVSVVSERGSKCYWCGAIVPHPEHVSKRKDKKRVRTKK